MERIAPLPMLWTGEAFEPLQRFRKLADQAWIVGEVYRVEALEERSMNSHRHYFASINEAWRNLSDDASERFRTAEHLRKWALIKAGYRDERSIVAGSKAEAQRIAAFIRPMDDYAVVIVRDAVVLVLTAKSQSIRSMGAKDFQKSKQDVLDILSEMLGVESGDLQRARAA